MYSSGTTGVPKCIVHGQGGTLLQHLKELILHTDLKREDKICYITTCGWMMWNWLISSLAVGATVILTEGSATYPDIKTRWKKIEEEEITVFGTSPKFISLCMTEHIFPKEVATLSSLKTLLSTGSPLLAEQFEWVYDHEKRPSIIFHFWRNRYYFLFYVGKSSFTYLSRRNSMSGIGNEGRSL